MKPFPPTPASPPDPVLLNPMYARTNYVADRDPTADDGTHEGFFYGSRWFNPSTGSLFTLVGGQDGHAFWLEENTKGQPTTALKERLPIPRKIP